MSSVAAPLHLRVFVSSPGDVGDERAAALGVLSTIQNENWVRGKVTVEPVMWDDPDARTPMEANRTPQESVNVYKGRPSECDLTLLILWGRIGSPPALTRADGSRYESGTVWEYEDAAAPRDGRAPVPVWVYRCTRKRSIDWGDPQEDQKKKQFAAVDAFCARIQGTGGSATGGINDYADTAAFERLLHQHLEAFIRDRLERAPAAGLAPAVPSAPARDAKPWLVPDLEAAEGEMIRRPALMDKIWGSVSAGRHCCLVFLPGVGKTTAAHAFVTERRDALLKAFDGVLWADVGPPADQRAGLMEQLRKWANALSPQRDFSSLAHIDDWKEFVRDQIGERRMLIVLDDVWDAAQVQKLTGYMGLGQRCVFIVTTRLRPEVAMKLVGQDDMHEVEELGDDEGMRLMRAIAPNAVDADPQTTLELVQRVNGLPMALVLMGRYLKAESYEKDDRARIAAAFARLSEAGERLAGLPGNERLNEVVDLSYRSLDSDASRRALEALSILRPKPHGFSEAIAQEVCGVSAPMLRRLQDRGLIGFKRRDDGDGAEFSMHPVISAFAREKLPLPQRQALRRRTLDWYGRKLNADIEEDPGSYAEWYRYESADWQDTKDAWLYYLRESGDEAGSMLAFLRVFFDAFWWWGYYQRFKFCDQLIREWRLRDLRPSQAQGLDWLAEFNEAYPAGYVKGGHDENWKRVEHALTSLRGALGLNGDFAAIGGEDARRVRAFIDFFLAECLAYGHRDRVQALQRYTLAHDEFTQDRVPWVPAWIWFYVGQYLLELEDRDAAQAYTRRGLDDAGEAVPLAKRDPELLANLYRVLGDLALDAADTAAAAAAYRRALFYAFAFQAVPGQADSYTVEFYREITGRICQRLVDLYAQRRESARTLAKQLYAMFHPWRKAFAPADKADLVTAALKAQDAAQLGQCLFPPVPAVGDVIAQAPRLAADVLSVLDELRAAADVLPDPKAPGA